MTTTIHGLTYNISTRKGQCGAFEPKKIKTQLYFPFFRMGCCGDDRGVIPHDNTMRERLIAPNKMDYNWFYVIAVRIKQNFMFDWDWNSFSKNILRPNREHIKTELNISDEKVDLFLSDGFVFLNNFFEDYDKEEIKDEVVGETIGYFPNFKNFLEQDKLEY